LNKFAIVLSLENKKGWQERKDLPGESSLYEKMAIALIYSIREHMPDVDIYCGNFTNNKISSSVRGHFEKKNVHICDDLLFDKVDPLSYNGYLRNFTKNYFAKKLLDQYDYLVYTDVDVLFLKPLKFEFNPTDPIIIVDNIPRWAREEMVRFTKIPLDGNLYLNWFDIINKHNQHVFDINYTDPAVLYDHGSDIIITERIDNSGLTIIDQQFGGYHCFKPVTTESLVYHYDSLYDEGSLYMLENTHSSTYKKYVFFFEKVLGVTIENEVGKWEKIKAQFTIP